MALSKSQKKIAKQILSVGKKQGATRKELVSAIATGIVEANLSNPSSGHGTSAGWRQEIDTYGSVKKRTNVKGAARRYFNETASMGHGKGMSVGELSQAVQRSAYPDRYGEVAGQAKGIVSDLLGKGLRTAPSGSQRGSKSSPSAGLGKATDELRSAMLSFVQTEDKGFTDYLAIYEQRKALERAQDAQNKKASLGGVDIRGQSKDKPLKGTLELPKNSKKAIVELGHMAEKMGLYVGENPKFGGVDPVHASGSFHYSARAIDVSGDPRKMAKFANLVGKRYGPKLAELFWNGTREENWDEGSKVGKGYVSGHTDHVHVAI
jgi:hypothetical protein